MECYNSQNFCVIISKGFHILLIVHQNVVFDGPRRLGGGQLTLVEG